MTLVRQPADRIPLLLFFTFFAADLAVYRFATAWWVPVAWWALCLIPKGWVSAWNHHHQHVAMFKHGFMNRLLELGFSWQTGIVSNAWVLHHNLGHHVNYLEPLKDESGWMREDGTTMGVFEYTWVNTLGAYPRAFRVGLKHRKHLPLFLAACAWSLALVVTLVVLNPWNGFWLFVAAPLSSLLGTVFVTYYHHAGNSTADAHFASNNILDRAYNVVTGNLGYHTAHHVKQALHWSKLPELHAQLEKGIPAANYAEVGAPFSWLRLLNGSSGQAKPAAAD
jgi:fatty acid desaturase